MTPLSLSLTLSLVGPRQDLLDKPAWPMALRVAIGTVTKPNSSAAGVELILGTLPWMVWPNALPDVVIVDQTGSEISRCKPLAPLTDNVPFLEALRTAVLRRGQTLAKEGRLTFTFGGQPQELQDADRPLTLPWPGLMNTLSTLAQPTPSALKVTWFFTVDRGRLAEVDIDGNWQLKSGIAISAAPVSVLGASYTSTQVGPDPMVQVHSYSTADVRAHCQLLGLEGALAHGLDELDNYWLSIRDSRDDSLLDLAHLLETALGPGAILSALSIDEWANACESKDGDSPPRPASVGEMKAALALWGQKERVDAVSRWVAEKRRSIIRDALLNDDDTVQAIRQGYIERARHTLGSLCDVPQKGISTRVRDDAMASLLILLRDRLLPTFAPRDPRPCQPDEGIELVVGDELMRLRHQDQLSDPAVDDVAAIQFFGRRSSDVTKLDAPDEKSPVDWHALSGARYAVPSVDNGDTWVFSTDRVLGVTAGYVDEVLYRELTYSGGNLVCRNPMERVHRENLADDELGAMLAQLQRRTSAVWELRALPLRYGDHYEFAASVIDRAGGMAAELSLADQPWAFDPTSIARLAPPQWDRVRFLRRVAVGHCNILPPAGGWPQTPDEVWLRCLEEAPRPAENVARPTSVLLVPADSNGFRNKKSGVGWPASVAFGVEAPRLDEHTLLRWSMPATNLAPAVQKVAVDDLMAALTAIHSTRDKLLSEGGNAAAGGLPFDPAVTALGVRYRFDGQVEVQHIVAAQSASITVVCGDADRLEIDAHTLALRFVVAPGSHVRLGFVPLIAPDDFERMDAEALSGLLEHQPEHQPWLAGDGRPFGAFAESVVFAESATAELPDLRASDLSLSTDGTGNVEVRYAFSRLDAVGQRRLRHVHQMRISCERWVWRNLPVPARDAADAKTSPAEWRRRLSSGPPPEIMDAARRDAPDSELVSYFDKLVGLDQGFVRREEVILRFPRDRSDEIALYVDARDGITAADYLRYQLSLRSRYRGVLVKQDGDAVGPRRIGVPFRGNSGRIKPPKLLAVLPLTRAMGASPRPTEKGAGSAFLVVLDEPWFREYGMGERLCARVAHVKTEVGETTEPPEHRFGPLPDHSVVPLKGAELDRLVTDDLDCFGPFGFSLDRGSSQAMANATGFVVYPPAGTPPHYNLFLEFARLLDIPSGAPLHDDGTVAPLESVRSDALPLYTLPDSDALNPRSQSLKLTKLGHGQFSYNPAEVENVPFPGATGDVLLQYRYLLIVGRLVRDGGRAVDVFLPEDGLWLSAGDLRLLGSTDRDISGCKAAVIAEALLNGRPGKADPLGDAKTLREFFLMIFGATDKDAPGMIRRFSQVFDIAFL